MPGGLLNLVAYGNLNVIINGNPSKTFFKTTYAKYTNFGLQKFRLEFDGLRSLRLTEDSHFSFKVPRYADLFMDTYFVITLPTIWSPILTKNNNYYPYEFKWIENLGAQLIRKVRFMIGGQIIQEFTGQYLYNMVQRDFSEGKKKLFDEMIGNVPELNDPANYNNRNRTYPNTWHDPSSASGPEPSIPSKTLYIPLNIWSTLSSKMAIPLVSLQYNYFHIEIDCRPIQELFVVRDINLSIKNPNVYNQLNTPYIRANQNEEIYKFNRFLYPPPKQILDGEKDDDYPDNTQWYANMHLLSTYGFLSEQEVKVFAAKPQTYLIKEVHEELFYNISSTPRTRLNSAGLVASWMWFFQRSDAPLRNEWSNYTNWQYKDKPSASYYLVPQINNHTGVWDGYISRTQEYNPETRKYIMTTWGLLLDGKIRENTLDAGVFNLVEKYTRTAGNADLGLYCYNFCLNTDPFQLQPSGAINLSKFNHVEFEYSTLDLPFDASAQTFVICDDDDGIIGVNKPTWSIHKYDYNLYVMEERYNILTFESGQAGLKFAR